MADEEVVVAAETTTSVSSSDNHKRKLEDLEHAAPGESVLKVEAVSDSAENPKAEVIEGGKGENEAHVDGSEAKRLRLEDKVDDIGAENGHREETKRGESKEDDTVEKSPCLDSNIQLDNGPEVDDIHTEEKKGHESEVDYSGEKPVSSDHCRQLDDAPKVDNEAQETTISEQLAPINDLETSDVQESNNNDELQKYYNTEEPCKGEVHEPSSSLPQQAGAPNDQDKNITMETQTVSHILEVPNNKVGVIIGKGGETIRHLQFNSGAKIQITRDSDSDPHSTTRPVELIGTLDSVVKAEKLIKDVIAEADAGGSPSLVAKGFNPVQSVIGDQIEMKVPIEKVGLIIGKSGETIKNLQARSGARIQLVQLPDGEQVKERTIRVSGERKQIERAREMIQEVMDQVCTHFKIFFLYKP
ncbi:unnamed protein product [Cuscuta campestris]|uniref:K Homology domain-containing protein n=1 Tax=Cuscuta campestris TaxID=132261 RepID=A0A484M0S9_9ASTE|nr:unnamed protein product [Cuscuta campestris]